MSSYLWIRGYGMTHRRWSLCGTLRLGYPALVCTGVHAFFPTASPRLLQVTHPDFTLRVPFLDRVYSAQWGWAIPSLRDRLRIKASLIGASHLLWPQILITPERRHLTHSRPPGATKTRYWDLWLRKEMFLLVLAKAIGREVWSFCNALPSRNFVSTVSSVSNKRNLRLNGMEILLI